MATIVGSASGGTRAWSDTASWVGGVVPTATSDVTLTAASGNITIDSGAVCRSLDCTGYVGVLTHNSVTLTIGDGTAGLLSRALTLVSGMTYTLTSASSAVSFVSTSTTQQTITTGGKGLGNWTVNGVGSSYLLSDANTVSGGTVTLTSGTLNTGSQACSWAGFAGSGSVARTLTMGSSAITVGASGWSTNTFTNLTITSNTAVLTFNTTDPLIVPGNNTINYNGASLVFTGAGNALIQHGGAGSVITFANVTRTGTAVKTDTLSITSGTGSGGLVCTGAFVSNGQSVTNRVLVKSVTVGSAVKITAATVTLTNTDFMDVTAAGVASPFTGTSLGDALGNTSITTDAPVTQTHTSAAGGNWSDVSVWTSRVPLPQDAVVVNVNTTGTLTADMPRLGATLTFTGFAGTLTPSVAVTLYGGLVLASGMTLTSNANGITLGGRSSLSVTSAGISFQAHPVTVAAPTGTYTQVDALVTTAALALTNGTWTTGGFALTCLTFAASASTTINLGASTVALTGTSAGAVWTANATTTVNAGTSDIQLTVTSTSTRSFAGGGKTYYKLTYTLAGSTGTLTLTGSNTFDTITFSDASNQRTLRFTSSTTTTITTLFSFTGTSGKLMKIDATTSGTQATLSKTSGVVTCDYISVTDNAATGGAAWIAGPNSVSA